MNNRSLVAQSFSILLIFLLILVSQSVVAAQQQAASNKKASMKSSSSAQYKKNKLQSKAQQKAGSKHSHRKHPKHKGREYAEREILIKFSTGASARQAITPSRAITRMKKRGKLKLDRLNRKNKWRSSRKLEQWRKVKIPQGTTIEEALAEFAADPDIEVVEPNYILRPLQLPNDPHYPILWGMQKIKAEGAWEFTTGDSAPIVAVIDTGVDYTHADLADNMWTNPWEIPDNQIDDDGNGYVDDVYGINAIVPGETPMDSYAGHGTHVAGIIGAVGNNLEGVTGVNWNTKIMSIRFMNRHGGTIADAIESIEYAVSMGAKIANLSWGGGGYSQALKDAMATAGDAGMLFVAAAGNSGRDNDGASRSYPASYDLPNIISVAATDDNDLLTYFSNYGATSVDIAAPGVRVYSTGTPYFCTGGMFARCYGPFDEPTYYGLSGTSMAAPHVAGVAALLWGKHPGMTIPAVKARLLDGTDPLPHLTGKVLSGGRINAEKVLAEVIPEFDYEIKILPDVEQLDSGEASIVNVRIGTGTSFTDEITLDLITSNNLIDASLDSVAVNPGPGASILVPLTFSTDVSLPVDKYAIHANGHDQQGRVRTGMITLDMDLGADYSISATPQVQNIGYGNTVTYDITIDSINSYSGTINLEAVSVEPAMVEELTQLSSLPEGVSVTFNPSTLDIAAGGSASSVMTVTTPATPLDKDYRIQFSAADAYKSVVSSVELGVWREGIDLALSSVVAEKLDGAAANELNLGFRYKLGTTLKNQGSQAIDAVSDPAIYNFYYLSDDNIIDSSDLRVASYGIRGLAVGEGYESTSQIYIPTNLVPGTYYLGAIADPYNSIVESDEVNNTVVSLPIQIVNELDLEVSSVSVSASNIDAGSTLSVSVDVRNTGATTLPDNSAEVAYFLSVDTNYSADDSFISSQYLSEIQGGASLTQTVDLILPYSKVAGEYYIVALADYRNRNFEVSETNNTWASSPIFINNDVNFRLDSVAPVNASITVEDLLGVNYSVTNTGTTTTGTVRTIFSLSSDGVTPGKFLGARYLSPLAGGETTNFNASFRLDSSMAGNHYLIVNVDSANLFNESDETDNVLSSSAMVEILDSNTDLVMSQLSSVSSVMAGSTINVTSTVTNIGTSPVDPGHKVTLYLLQANVYPYPIRVGEWTSSLVLDGGASETRDLAITIPPTLGGTYFIQARADTYGLVDESDELNNRLDGNNFEILPNQDIELTSVSSWPAQLGVSGSSSLSYTVTNTGSTPIGSPWFGSFVFVLLSTDTNFDYFEDTFLAYTSAPQLSAGGSYTGTIPFDVPANLAVGSYYIGVVADGPNYVPESNEANNVLFSTVNIVNTDYDLKGLNVSSSVTDALAGSDIIISSTVGNVGTSSVPSGHMTGLYLSADTTIDTNDIYLGSWPSFVSLANGASESRNILVTIPESTSTGDYYLGAIANYDGAVEEADNTNNGIASVATISITGAAADVDLVINSVSASEASVAAGGSLTINTTVQNNGTSTLAAGQAVGLYLSSDAIIDVSDTYLGSVATTIDLANSANESVEMAVVTPTALAVGSYYIGAIADATNAVTETDETNNAKASANVVRITGDVDLSVTAISDAPASLSAGDTLTISSTVTNTGTDSIASGHTTTLYLSTDDVVDANDIPLGSWVSVNQLAGGASESQDVVVTWPSTLAAGDYFIGAMADTGNVVPESNESNNWIKTTHATIVITCTVDNVLVDCVTGEPIPTDRALLCPERVFEPIYGRYCDYQIPTVKFSAYRLQHAYDGEGFNQGTTFAEAFQLNDNSDVVGSAVTSTGEIHAARINVGDSNFTNLYITDLGQPGLNSVARSVNNVMTYTGQIQVNAGDVNQRDAIWHTQIGNYTPIDTLGTERGVGVDTARNQYYVEFVAGYSVWNNEPGTSDGLEHGYVWSFDGTNQTVTRIGAIGEENRANAINDSQVVVGYKNVAGNKVAYRSTSGNITPLPDAGGNDSQALAVNNNVSDKIVGYSTDTSAKKQAVIWQNSIMHTLPSLAAASDSTAKAITDGGDIVGQSNNRAVFWRNGGVYDLNDALDNIVNVTFTDALDINRRGRVLVRADDGSYYVLIPSSE